MKKEDLINKWLDHDLSQKELEAFEKIDWAASKLKAPEYDVDSAWSTFSASVSHTNKSSKISWFRYVAGIAAVFMLGFIILNSTDNNLQTVETLAQNKIEFNLPDASNVTLNLTSNVTYDPDNWNDDRSLTLDGEAFFEVAKGKKFTVNTASGTVEVLGTQFNVYNRDNFFAVHCFEGTVKVNHNNKDFILKAGEKYMSTSGKSAFKMEQDIPSWKLGKSSFESVPLHVAIKEIEIQHNIQLDYPQSISQSLYTGSISHKNLELALQAITIPFNLEYSINGKTVMLKQRP